MTDTTQPKSALDMTREEFAKAKREISNAARVNDQRARQTRTVEHFKRRQESRSQK